MNIQAIQLWFDEGISDKWRAVGEWEVLTGWFDGCLVVAVQVGLEAEH